MQTLEAMKEANIGSTVLESDSVLILNRKVVEKRAQHLGISLSGVTL